MQRLAEVYQRRASRHRTKAAVHDVLTAVTQTRHPDHERVGAERCYRTQQRIKSMKDMHRRIVISADDGLARTTGGVRCDLTVDLTDAAGRRKSHNCHKYMHAVSPPQVLSSFLFSWRTFLFPIRLDLNELAGRDSDRHESGGLVFLPPATQGLDTGLLHPDIQQAQRMKTLMARIDGRTSHEKNIGEHNEKRNGPRSRMSLSVGPVREIGRSSGGRIVPFDH